MLYKHLFMGGIQYMLPIYILGVVAIILTAYLFYKVSSAREPKPEVLKKLREYILFLGSLAFIWGIIGQTTGIMDIMDSIAQAGGPLAPTLIAEGFKISSLTTTYGLVIFLFSFIAWFVARMKTK